MATIICTACSGRFRGWQAWRDHRVAVPMGERHCYHGHSERCLSPEEWTANMLQLLASQQASANEGEKSS